MLPTITLDGRLVADPELRFTPGGKAVASMRVAANDSRKLDDGSYENLEQIFVNVSLWETEAEHAVEVLAKGDRVLVTGRIYQREYDTRDGGKGTSLEIKFPTVAKVVAPPRTTNGGQQRSTSGSSGRSQGAGQQRPTPQRPAAQPAQQPAQPQWNADPTSYGDEPPF